MIRFFYRSVRYLVICLAAPLLGLWLGKTLYQARPTAAPPPRLPVSGEIPAGLSTRHKLALHLQSGDWDRLCITIHSLSEPELLTALELDREWSGGQSTNLTDTLRRRLTRLNPGRVVDEIMQERQGVMRCMRLADVFAAWARQDPRAAYARWLEIRAENDNSDCGQLGIFPQLAKVDLAYAFAEFRKIAASENFRGREEVLGGIVTAGMKAGKKEEVLQEIVATDQASRHPGNAKYYGMKAYFQSQDMKDPAQRAALVEYANKERYPMSREDLLLVAVMRLRGDPQQADTLMAFARETHLIECLRQLDFREKISDQSAAEAAEWYMRQPLENPSDLSRRYATITQTWAAMDTNACGAWLKQQPPEAPLDEARRAFALRAASTDAVAAFAWAAEIHEPGLRQNATSGVLINANTQGRSIMKTAVQASSLPASEKAVLLERLN
jgi:hypothetical protein